MKKILLFTVAVCLTILLNAKPTTQLLKIFKESFPDAQNAKWHEDETGYLVSFTQMNIPTKVTYDKKGNYINSLRYYDEKALPLNVILTIKKRYPGKKIFGVTEFANMYGIAYYIKLQDEKNWYTVKATADGTLEMQQRYKKATE